MTRNVEMLVRAARALGDFRDEVVFVGGAVVELFITDPAAPRPRFTEDVDVVVEVTTQGEWARVGERLRALGFREDQREGAPVCRWLVDDLVMDDPRRPADVRRDGARGRGPRRLGAGAQGRGRAPRTAPDRAQAMTRKVAEGRPVTACTGSV